MDWSSGHGRLLVAIVGPTGTGKSALAIRLAEAFQGEIIDADSLQIYRYMDIGTAKPSPSDRQRVPHHLFDIVNPDQDFSLGEYLALARQTIEAIYSRDRLPFLVGGSGQYVRAVLEGWEVPRVLPDSGLRRDLEEFARNCGSQALHARLIELDPESAAAIDYRNTRRVIRALEVTLTAGTKFSVLRHKQPPRFVPLVIGLTSERNMLYGRLDERAEEMLRQGLVQETEELLRRGYDAGLPALNSVGYKQISQMLRGEVDYPEAAKSIRAENHRLVRHQYAWFRLSDRRIVWFDIQDDITLEAMQLVGERLSGG